MSRVSITATVAAAKPPRGRNRIRPSVGWLRPCFHSRASGARPLSFRAGLLLAGEDYFHDLRFLAVHCLEHVCDNPVITFDDHLVAALDLLAGQRAAFLRGANQLCAGGVEAAEAMGDRAT